jgi:hypothetical protein
MQTGHRVVVERVFPDATWPRLTFRSLEGGILALDKHASGSVGPYDVSAEEFEKHMEVVSEKKSSKPVKSATEWDTVNNEVWNLRVGAVVVERGDAYSDKPRWEFVQLHSKWSGREACKHSLVELAPLDARGNRTGEPIMVQQQEFCTRYEEWCTDSHMCSKSTAMAEVIRANDEQHKKMHQAMLDCKNASKKKMAKPAMKAAPALKIKIPVQPKPKYVLGGVYSHKASDKTWVPTRVNQGIKDPDRVVVLDEQPAFVSFVLQVSGAKATYTHEAFDELYAYTGFRSSKHLRVLENNNNNQ